MVQGVFFACAWVKRGFSPSTIKEMNCCSIEEVAEDKVQLTWCSKQAAGNVTTICLHGFFRSRCRVGDWRTKHKWL